MDVIEYYHNQFGEDMLRAKNALSVGHRDRISFVNLLPDDACNELFVDDTVTFRRVTGHPRFLMCFFFSALIDQAVHSSLREEHSFFDHLARYPKFVGILSSYRSNLHPTWLLLAATLYADPRDATVATRDFEQLTDYFVQDYVNFFQVQYPQVTGRLKCPADRILAIRQVLGDIVQALEPREVVLSLGPSTQRTPDLRLYRHWVSYCRDGMQQKLNEVTHIGDISTGGGAETPPPVT